MILMVSVFVEFLFTVCRGLMEYHAKTGASQVVFCIAKFMLQFRSGAAGEPD